MSNKLSQKDLGELYSKEIKRRGRKTVQEIIKEKRVSELGRKKKKSIFLSHSHLDKTIVSKIALLFNKVDVEIYVDWMDEALPMVTDKNTALTIRKKIEHCHRFLFLATARGLQSKWCDWELGIAYSIKKENEIAILPIESKSGKWKGSEYLQLYPEMRFDVGDFENVNEDGVHIYFEEDRFITLENWLTN